MLFVSLAVPSIAFAGGSPGDTDQEEVIYAEIPAPPLNFHKEADKADFIRRVAPYSNFIEVFPTEGNASFCHKFLEDFLLQREIRHVEPVAKSDPFEASTFRQYIEQCPALDLRLRVTYGRSNDPLYNYGLRSASLFKGDFNQNPNDGEELIFQIWDFVDLGHAPSNDEELESELKRLITAPSPMRPLFSSFEGAYNFVELSSCQVGSVLQSSAGSANTLAGLIEYKNAFFIYEYRFEQSAIRQNSKLDRDLNGYLQLNGLDTAQRGGPRNWLVGPYEICYFR